MMRRFALLALLTISAAHCASAESNIRAATSSSNNVSSHQHRELGISDWWYTLLNSLHISCPHDSTEDHPTGHCAHPSHKPHVHHSSGSHSSSSSSGGGGSSSSSSSGCTDDNNGSGCWDNDGHTDETTDDKWAADGHTDEATDDATEAVWADDGYTDDTTDDATEAVWGDDGYTDDTTDDTTDDDSTEWGNDGYSFAKSSLNYRTHSSGGGGGNGAKWAAGAGVVGLVGVGALVASKKRKRSEDEQDNNVPESVYIQETDQPAGHAAAVDTAEPSVASGRDYMNNEPASIEMQSVNTTMTRTQRIKASLAAGGASIKSRFGRTRSFKNDDGDVGGYQAPNAEENGAAFDHESIASNDQKENGGAVV